MTPEERFAEIVGELLCDPDVTPPSEGRRFGAAGLKIHGKIFAMLSGDRLVVKLPKGRVDTLVMLEGNERFDPKKNGQVMKEWVCVGPAYGEEWLSLAKEAMEFVALGR